MGPSRTFLWPREEGFRSFGSISHLSDADRGEIDPKLFNGVPRIPSAKAWEETEAEFGERLRSVAEHINAHYGVEVVHGSCSVLCSIYGSGCTSKVLQNES